MASSLKPTLVASLFSSSLTIVKDTYSTLVFSITPTSEASLVEELSMMQKKLETGAYKDTWSLLYEDIKSLREVALQQDNDIVFEGTTQLLLSAQQQINQSKLRVIEKIQRHTSQRISKKRKRPQSARPQKVKEMTTTVISSPKRLKTTIASSFLKVTVPKIEKAPFKATEGAGSSLNETFPKIEKAPFKATEGAGSSLNQTSPKIEQAPFKATEGAGSSFNNQTSPKIEQAPFKATEGSESSLNETSPKIEKAPFKATEGAGSSLNQTSKIERSGSSLMNEIALLKEWHYMKIEPSELEISDQLLGKGNFASVYKGKWRGSAVAVKIFQTKVKEPEFLKELNKLSTLRHPGLVQYMGYCRDENMSIVMEYMDKGSLFDLLHGGRCPKLSWNQKLKMATEVAATMEFLHQSKICHLDLNSKNILVDHLLKVKIADLGLSEEISQTDIKLAKRVGTLRWMSPEMLKRICKSFEKSDVWSFGIIMFELGTLAIPYHDKVESDVKSCLQKWIPPEPPTRIFWREAPEWGAIMKHCWEKDYEKRPTFKEIHDNLVKIQV